MKKIILLLIGFTFLTHSCSNWLDVEPKSQVKDDELFSSQAGFKEALAGVYSTLVTESLYTKELRFAMLGILAQEWDTYSSIYYGEDNLYNYESAYPKNRISAIWNGMYNAIANVNVLLEEIDAKQNLFTGVNYEVIKGEALALRAFIHFDLLRCFGASFEAGKDKPSIPYVEIYTHLQTKQSTVEEVIDKVIIDLKEAEKYLLNDPIYTGQVITEIDDEGYLINRQLHLNYYAVKALQARVYLYKNDYNNAAECAQEVINSNQFTWNTYNNLFGKYDLTGATEQIWGIDVNNLSTIVSNNFTSLASTQFSLTNSKVEEYYTDTDDYRYLYLFTISESNSNIRFTAKYNTPETDSQNSLSPNYYRNKMVMLKLPEMYLILAECEYQQGLSPLSTLNILREKRSVALLQTEPIDFYSTLMYEYRAEFLAEGQLFFYYKRRNMQNIPGTDLNLVDTKAYIFPIPDSEYEAADRENNR